MHEDDIPDTKPPLNEESADEKLRAQYRIELENIRQCAYKPYDCTQLSLDGYNYCQRHILCDKVAPFKQCAYTYPTNSKHCYLPVEREKRDAV